MNILPFKLITEGVMSNILMHAIVALGFLATIAVAILANAYNPYVHYYVPVVFAGTFYGASLPHYFLHYCASYLALKGDPDIKAYEVDRQKHTQNSLFVGAANIFTILILIGVSYNSFAYMYNYDKSGVLFLELAMLVVSLLLFVAARGAAKVGWEKLKS